MTLDPFGLEARAGDKGIVIARAATDPARRDPSEVQKQSALRIEEVLAKPTTFEFKHASLESVAEHFEGETGENFVPAPAGRMAGVVDPDGAVSGAAVNAPLREGLAKLLAPLGLEIAIKDEVVLFQKSARRCGEAGPRRRRRRPAAEGRRLRPVGSMEARGQVATSAVVEGGGEPA